MMWMFYVAYENGMETNNRYYILGTENTDCNYSTDDECYDTTTVTANYDYGDRTPPPIRQYGFDDMIEFYHPFSKDSVHDAKPHGPDVTHNILFRKQFMQLKTFKNLRFK